MVREHDDESRDHSQTSALEMVIRVNKLKEPPIVAGAQRVVCRMSAMFEDVG